MNILFQYRCICVYNKHKLYSVDKLVAYMYVKLAAYTNSSW